MQDNIEHRLCTALDESVLQRNSEYASVCCLTSLGGGNVRRGLDLDGTLCMMFQSGG